MAFIAKDWKNGPDTTTPLSAEALEDMELRLSALAPVIVRKTSNEIVNNSAGLQDDDHLFISVEANTVYVVEAKLIYGSGTTPDIKFGWTAPSGASFDWANAEATIALLASGLASTDFEAGTGVGTKLRASLDGLLVIGSTAGTFRLQWAQNTADPTDTTVYANSYIRIQKVV